MVILQAVCFSILILSIPANSDWMNLTGSESAPTIAEIYIMEDHIKVVLEVYIGDLMVFQNLLSDDVLQEYLPDQAPYSERFRRFYRQDFQFITGSGQKLKPEIALIESRIRIDRTTPYYYMLNPLFRPTAPPKDKRVLYVELVYPFSNQPRELTIVPPLDEQGNSRSTIGFIAYHKAVPIIDFRFLSQSESLTLDWSDPWYSKFDNPNLSRHHKTGLFSFLYVEPIEVRHEILTRVKDMEGWMDLGLRGDRYIEADEFEGLKQRIGEFLLDKNPVLIDGQAHRPILDRMDYIRIGLSGIEFLRQPEPLEISTAIVGVIITYITEEIPQEVTIEWELFNDRIQNVPATATDPAGPFLSYVTPDDNVLTWTNYLKNFEMPVVEQTEVTGFWAKLKIPLVSLAFLLCLIPLALQIRARRKKSQPARTQYRLGAVLVMAVIVLFPFFRVSLINSGALAATFSEEESKEILHRLLQNVYRSFDFREEEDVYDKLALSVSGDLLADIYLQNRRSFEVQRAGGAQAKVQEVEILEVAVGGSQRPGALDFRSKWTAFGTVGHWGHIHARTNRYEAIVTLAPVEGAWKIMGLELLEETRIDPMAQAQAESKPPVPTEER